MSETHEDRLLAKVNKTWPRGMERLTVLRLLADQEEYYERMIKNARRFGVLAGFAAALIAGALVKVFA